MKFLSQYVNEQLTTLMSQRMNINVQRLAYLKFAMEDNSKNKGLKKMYDTLYKLTFDKDGHVRTNKELYDYLEQTMEDNLGDIPGLPSNSAVEAIDKKIQALDELDPKKLQHYIKEVEKEVSDAESNADQSDNKVKLEKDLSDEALIKKVSEIIDKEGLTNILGLEKMRKMSKEDKKKILQKEESTKLTGSTDDEGTEEKKKEEGEKKEEQGEQKPTEGGAGDAEKGSEEPPQEEEPSKEEEPEKKSDEDIEAELDKQIDALDDEDLEELEDLDDEDFEDLDELASEEDIEKVTTESIIDISDSFVFEMSARRLEKKQQKALDKHRGKLEKRDKLSAFLRDHPGGAIAAIIGRKKSKKQMALLQKKIDDASDPTEKEKLEKQKNAIKLTSFDSRGKYIGGPLAKKAREKQLIKDGMISKEDLPSREEKKQLRKEAKEFAKSDEGKSYMKDAKKELKREKAHIKSGLEKEDAEAAVTKKVRDKVEGKEEAKQERKTEKNAAKTEKMEVAKDEDGSEIHPRAKKNGDGVTYVRIKDGKEVGYASKSEYQAAMKKKNE